MGCCFGFLNTNVKEKQKQKQSSQKTIPNKDCQDILNIINSNNLNLPIDILTQ